MLPTNSKQAVLTPSPLLVERLGEQPRVEPTGRRQRKRRVPQLARRTGTGASNRARRRASTRRCWPRTWWRRRPSSCVDRPRSRRAAPRRARPSSAPPPRVRWWSGRRSMSRSVTGLLNRNESPRSPCSDVDRCRSANCVSRSTRSARTARCRRRRSRRLPVRRARVQGSPGISRATAKTSARMPMQHRNGRQQTAHDESTHSACIPRTIWTEPGSPR